MKTKVLFLFLCFFSMNNLFAQSKIKEEVTHDIERFIQEIEQTHERIIGEIKAINHSDSIQALEDLKGHIEVNNKCFKEALIDMGETLVFQLKPLYDQKITLKENGLTNTHAYKNLLNDIENKKEFLTRTFSKDYNKAYKRILNLSFKSQTPSRYSRVSICHDTYSVGGISYLKDIDTYSVGYYSKRKYISAIFNHTETTERIWEMSRKDKSKKDIKREYKIKSAKRLIGIRKCKSDLCTLDTTFPVIKSYLEEIESVAKRSFKLESIKVAEPETDTHAGRHADYLEDAIVDYSKQLSSVILH
jgi:hypothetical protein